MTNKISARKRIRKRWIALAAMLLLTGGITWGFTQLVVDSTGQDVRLSPKQFEQIREALPVQPERVSFQSKDGVRLAGWYWPARGLPADQAYAVIAVHGGTSSKAKFVRQALALNAAGYAVLLPDLRNHGESGNTPQGLSMGIREERDVEAAAAFLSSRGLRHIAAWGASMGGIAVVGAAAADTRIGPLILESTSTDGARPFAYGLEQAGLPKGRFTNGLARWFGFFGLLRMGANVKDAVTGRLPVYDQAKALSPRPVLMIAGADDPIVPLPTMRSYAKLFAGSVRFHVVPDEMHVPSERHPEKVVSLVHAFLKNWRDDGAR